ncbi:MAG: glycosyltransferase [Melioribacteraceae bacterium]|nr:glycosyltransferase [Melioribacteraceae bacterium]MCF8352812.1 glycosyltransferase [Melioribacteraceae bacterium]MCF8393468.1 glycosyltransferase [Melioribacteraceae bacterium]MCF8417329.1 glycosyltransferase [Melioribacteraceae bacterium]
MFKVLVIAYYFPPMGLSGVQRTLKFAKYMSEFNWEPTVITAGDTAYFAHDMSLLKEAEDAKINIVRTEGFDPNSILASKGTVKIPREFIRRNLSRASKTIFIPDNKISWSQKAAKKAMELLKSEAFDLIYVTIPPYSAFSEIAKIKKIYDIPLIVDYRDPWYGNHFAFYPSPFHKVKHKKMEDTALRAADKVIVINRRIKEHLLTTYKFLTFDDIVIIPQGYDSHDFENGLIEKRPDSKMRITYSGIFYEDITPKYFLKAFKKISLERPDIAQNIELHFAGLFRKENEKLVRKLNLQDFVVNHGYLDHVQTIKIIKNSDILWMMLPDIKSYDVVSTGKLFEYFGARKPVLACVGEGASKSASLEYGASYIVSPNDIDGIKNIIYKIHSQFKNNELPQPNEDFVLRHDRKYLTELLTKQFQFYLRSE